MGLINLLGIINEGLYNLVSSLYTFLGTLYNFLVGLSDTEFLKETYLNDFTTTVYVLAGIFMLFRVAVSFLSALVDPDKLSDKNESPSKLLTRMIIVIVLMIALVPNSYVYDYLNRLQNAIINPNDGLIVNLFSKAKKKAEKDAEKEGRTLNNDGLQFSRNLLGTMTNCEEEGGSTTHTSDNENLHGGSSGKFSSYPIDDNNLMKTSITNSNDVVKVVEPNTMVGDDVREGAKKYNENKVDVKTCDGLREALLDNTYRDDITDALDDKFSISWLIAILVGIAVIVYLLVLCIEVVVRGLKLVFLQMVAPIAIISYVSPKDKILPEWAKMYVSTYIDIFIKLIAIQIGALFLLGFQFSEEPIKNLFVILGILVFMKLIPTMISKIFGIDLASGTFKDSMGILKTAAGVGALGAGSMIARGVSRAANLDWKGNGTKKDMFKNAAKNTAKSLGAGVMGATAGIKAGAKGEKLSTGFFKDQAKAGIDKRNKEIASDAEYGKYLEKVNSENNKIKEENEKIAEDNKKNGTQKQLKDYKNPMSKGQWKRKAKFEERLRSYLGVPGEKEKLEVEKKVLENEKNAREKELNAFKKAESSFSTVLDIGADKIKEGETTSKEAKLSRQYTQMSSNLDNMTVEAFSRLSANDKAAYLEAAGYTDYSQSVKEIKTNLQNKIDSGEIKIDGNGKLVGATSAEVSLLTSVNGALTINDNAVSNFAYETMGVSFAELQNSMKDAAIKQKKKGDMDHLIREVLKGTTADGECEGAIKTNFNVLLNELQQGINSIYNDQFDVNLPEDAREAARINAQNLEAKYNKLIEIRNKGNGNDEAWNTMSEADREKYIAETRDVLKGLFKSGLKGQIGEQNIGITTVNEEIRSVDEQITAVDNRRSVVNSGDKK